MMQVVRLDRDKQRTLDRLLRELEHGRLTVEGEQRLRGLLAPLDSAALDMDRGPLYDFGRLTYGYMRLLDVAEGRARIVDVEPVKAP
jgi:hypothetical protein